MSRQSILYDAWGNERDRIGTSANKFTYTGHEKDEETGLIYAKARFYDPEIGRFLSQDTLLGNPEITPSLNRFSYVSNRPTVMVDPYGLYGEDVHRGLTYFLARGAGFDRSEAQRLGELSQSVDEDPETKPVKPGVQVELRKQLQEDEFLTVDISKGRWLISRADEMLTPIPELEKRLSDWHLPKNEGERFVEADSDAAKSKIRQAINLTEAATISGEEPDSIVYREAFRDFGRGLHPFQDSFSHEGGEFAHPFRGSPGDLDYSTALRSNTDWTFTTPSKSEQMAKRVLEEMIEFRRARGDANVPSFEDAWKAVEGDVQEFIYADTLEKKEAILNRWGVDKGESGEWRHIGAPEGEEVTTEQDGIWGKIRSHSDKIRSYTEEQFSRHIVEPWKDIAEAEIRNRINREERQLRRREYMRKYKQQHIVVPERPEGN